MIVQRKRRYIANLARKSSTTANPNPGAGIVGSARKRRRRGTWSKSEGHDRIAARDTTEIRPGISDCVPSPSSGPCSSTCRDSASTASSTTRTPADSRPPAAATASETAPAPAGTRKSAPPCLPAPSAHQAAAESDPSAGATRPGSGPVSQGTRANPLCVLPHSNITTMTTQSQLENRA